MSKRKALDIDNEEISSEEEDLDLDAYDETAVKKTTKQTGKTDANKNAGGKRDLSTSGGNKKLKQQAARDDDDDDEEEDFVFGDEDEEDEEDGEQEGDQDEDMKEIVSVGFDFYDPKPIDFLALKNMFNRLFCDLDTINSSELADLVIAQSYMGTTIKVDGPESDPYALLTVLNLHTHKSVDCIQKIVQLLLNKAAKKLPEDQNARLRKLLSPDDDAVDPQIGLMLSERFVNMPLPLVPPMYRMLQEELQWAVEEGKAYKFKHLLWISKTFKNLTSESGKNKAGSSKSSKPKAPEIQTLNYFNPEEELIAKYASIKLDFKINTPASDPKQTLDNQIIEPFRQLLLVDANKLGKIVKELEREFPPPS